VAALLRNSLEIVDGFLPVAFVIACTPWAVACRIAISSRSSGEVPACRRGRWIRRHSAGVPEPPLAHRLSHVASGSGLARKLASAEIWSQNCRSFDRGWPGASGDLIGALPVTSALNPMVCPQHFPDLGCCPPVKPHQFSSWAFTDRAQQSGPVPSMRSVAGCHDNATIEFESF